MYVSPSPLCYSFVLPNAVVEDSKPLTDFVVSLRELEAAAGLELLPHVFPVDQFTGFHSHTQPAASASEIAAPALTTVSESPRQLLLPSPGPMASGTDAPLALCSTLQCELPPANFWQPKAKVAPDSK